MPRAKRTPPSRPDAPVAVAAAEVLEPAVSDAVVDAVYREVRGLQRDATVELAIRIGHLVVDRFYGGDLDRYRSHGPKEASLRKLAMRFESDATGLSAAGLYRAVAMYELDRRLDLSSRKHMTVTHIRALLGLPEAEQRKLLEQTEERGWTSTQLEKRVAAVRKKRADGRGRPPLPAFVKTANLLGKVVGEQTAFDDLEALDGMEPESVRGVYDGIVKVQRRLAEIEAMLAVRLKAEG